MSQARRKLGDVGEQLAKNYLTAKGIEIFMIQERTPHGEIDLVGREGEEIVFVEVKTRTSNKFGFPEASVTPTKFQHMVRAAQFLLNKHNWLERPWRCDVVAISLNHGVPEIVHFPAIDNGCTY